LKDVIQGDGLKSLDKQSNPWQQGVGEASYLVEVLSLPGDIVLDPCCGTGTTALACKQTGRRFIGAEVSPETCNLAIQRIATESSDREPRPTEKI
jgi:site-specific DNA-methyltransferase (adenine-specific)